MRPAMALVLSNAKIPNLLTTVFAGQDREATEKAREYFVGYPPSSPSAAILKGGQVVYMMERHQIEGHTPQEIAAALKAAFDEHCD
jgi:putative YphP/YqiW family bacilliredoxin